MEGIDRFKSHFADFTDQYVLIGGAACTVVMEDDYYTFLQSGKKTVDGVQVAGPEHLIPMKAKAWLDLSKRKANGANIDSKDIRRHKNGVFRLFAIVDPEFDGHIPSQVKTDLAMFVARMPDEGVDLKAMGLGSETLDNVSSQLRRIYGLD